MSERERERDRLESLCGLLANLLLCLGYLFMHTYVKKPVPGARLLTYPAFNTRCLSARPSGQVFSKQEKLSGSLAAKCVVGKILTLILRSIAHRAGQSQCTNVWSKGNIAYRCRTCQTKDSRCYLEYFHIVPVFLFLWSLSLNLLSAMVCCSIMYFKAIVSNLNIVS